MSTFVNQVFVGKAVAAPADLDTMNLGEIALVDENGVAPTATSKEVRAVQVVSKKNVVLPDGTAKMMSVMDSSRIITKKDSLHTPEIKVVPYSAAIEQETTVDFSAAVIPAYANRMVVRIVHKDIEGAKIKMTRTYDHVSQSIVLANALTEITKKINKHSGNAVFASLAGDVITITGLVKQDAGKEAIDDFTQNEFEVYAYFTSTDVSLKVDEISGVAIETTTIPFKGTGTPELVRDREKTGLSHKGNSNFTHFPVGKPGLSVNFDKTYDTVIVEYNHTYRSGQEQYQESTPISLEIYAESGTGALIATALKTFFA